MIQSYTFKYQRFNDQGEEEPVEEVTFLNRGDTSLPELCQLFENFVKGCGYVLPEGVHIGYEED